MPAAKKKKKKVNGVLFCEADVLSWSCDVSGFGLYNVCLSVEMNTSVLLSTDYIERLSRPTFTPYIFRIRFYFSKSPR